MNISSFRLILVAAVVFGLISFFAIYEARSLHNEYERFLGAKLQADLINNEAYYKTAVSRHEEVSVMFLGDIMLSRGVDIVMRRNEDFTYPFLLSWEKTRQADVTFGNLEGPISERGTNVGSIYSFRANPEAVSGLEYAGIDVVSLANNHIYDWGEVAITDTVDILESRGIGTAGAGKNYSDANAPFVLTKKGISIGFLAYTNLYGENQKATETKAGISDLNYLESAIGELKNRVDIVVVSLHWGDEYIKEPSEADRAFGRRIVDLGADIVVGHHPHVVREIEQYGNGWIVYSLGNFVFDQTFSEDTRTGLVAIAKIKDKKITGVEGFTVYISNSFQPEFINL